MKNIQYIGIFVLVCCFCSCKQSNQFTLQGTVDTNYKGYVYLAYNHQLDSVWVDTQSNPHFRLQGELQKPTKATIYSKNTKDYTLGELMLEPSVIDLHCTIVTNPYNEKSYTSTDVVSVSGSQSQVYKESMDAAIGRIDTITNTTKKSVYINSILNSFIKEHPGSVLSGAYLNSLGHMYYNAFSLVQLETLFGMLNVQAQQPQDIEGIKSLLHKKRALAVGVQFPNVQLPDTNGTTLALHNVGASYVLIEFWASWCMPCIQQMPDLKQVYTNYHPVGFEIYAVSIDADTASWKNAITYHQLPWLQTIDAQKTVLQQLSIDKIPFNVLIDSDDKIVGTNLNSKALNDFLEKQL